MKESNLVANNITYNTIINACLKAHDIDTAFLFFDRMKEDQLKPDCITGTTIIKGLSDRFAAPSNFQRNLISQTTEKIISIFKSIEDCDIDQGLCNCAMEACLKANSLEKALIVYDKTKLLKIHLSTHVFGAFMKECCQEKNLSFAMQVLRDAE